MSPTISRRTALRAGLAALAVAVPGIGLAACGNDKSALSGNQTNTSDYDKIIADAPVADDATVSANAWAKKIKDRGQLLTGGSDSGPLFSM